MTATPGGYRLSADSKKFDPDSWKVKDADGSQPLEKGRKTSDAMNPVPRRTGLVPPKPTKARKNF